MQLLLRIIGYSTASLLVACGIAILSGFLPLYIPANFRVTFGVVLVVYGIFRVVTLYTKNFSRNRDENPVE